MYSNCSPFFKLSLSLRICLGLYIDQLSFSFFKPVSFSKLSVKCAPPYYLTYYFGKYLTLLRKADYFHWIIIFFLKCPPFKYGILFEAINCISMKAMIKFTSIKAKNMYFYPNTKLKCEHPHIQYVQYLFISVRVYRRLSHEWSVKTSVSDPDPGPNGSALRNASGSRSAWTDAIRIQKVKSLENVQVHYVNTEQEE